MKSPISRLFLLAICCLLLIFCFVFLSSYFAHAQSTDAPSANADDLQSKIDQRNQDIASLEKEIKTYQAQIDSLGSQADTLSSTLKSLDLTKKKLEANIAVTQDQISAKNLQIQQLGSQISDKEGNIEDDRRIVAHSFATMYEYNEQSIPELLLSNSSVADALDSLDQLAAIQNGLHDHIGSLTHTKTNLEANKKATEKAKADLVALTKQLTDQKAVVLSTVGQQNALLKQTNQSETAYKNLLADRQAQEASLQQEIESYESQLHITVNKSLIPHTGTGVLSWPLDKIRVTQYFGNTPFATANPQIYNGKGHTGVDFAASIGTPVKAALTGIIVGVSNTDLVPGCYSYGKWIMIKHADGLSTLYAHLSVQSVAVGQTVQTGDIIGYSGNTGYTTGPHLHFGVYATQGVVIKDFSTSINCKGAIIPIADFSAYLNPLSYL